MGSSDAATASSSTEGVHEEDIDTNSCIREFYKDTKAGGDGDHYHGHPPLTLLEFAAEEVGVDVGVLEALGVKLGGVGGEGGGVVVGKGSVVLCFRPV